MRAKPYLYSFLGGVLSFGAMFTQLKPLSPVIVVDPRLDSDLVKELTGLSIPSGKPPVLASFGLGLTLPVQPPSLYIGFDRPAADMESAVLKERRYQLVTAFHSLQKPRRPLSAFSDGLRDAVIATDDKILYARFRGDFPKLAFRQDTETVFNARVVDENTFAFLNTEKVTPRVRALSDPFSVPLWIGWKRSPSVLSGYLGVNKKMDATLQQLFRKTQIQESAPPTMVAAVGDIMLGRGIGKRLSTELKQKGRTNFPFGGAGINGLLVGADIAIGNLECAISNRGNPMPAKGYTFRAEPNAVKQLTSAGFDILTLGNNHSKDYGSDALLDTLRHLSEAGIVTIGAGSNRKDARLFKVITTADGTRVGFLGYTMVLPRDFLPSRKSAGVAWAKESGLEDDLAAARVACDVLMVQYHWGVEYTVNPTDEQRKLAHKTIDLGADIVIGHHPHWIQEVEFYKDKFIAYSLGNFVFDMAHRPKVTEGLIVRCEIRNKKIVQVYCDPVSLKGGQPDLIEPLTPLKRNAAVILKEIFAASGFL